MIRARWFFLVGRILLFTLIGLATAGGQTTVSVSPSSKNALPGSLVTLNVTVAGVTNLHLYHVILHFDNTVLRLESVSNGTFFPGTFFIYSPSSLPSDSARYLTVDDALVGTQTLSGSGNFFSVQFRVLQEGTSAVTLTEVVLRDASNQNISHTVVHGSVTGMYPPQVWVSGLFSPGNAGGHEYGFDAFQTVTEGIGIVAPAGTVHVLAGTYHEQLYINKNVTLIGAGATATTVGPPAALMNQPFLPASTERPIIGVDSLGTNVVIDGLTVDGEGAGATQPALTGIHFFKSSGAIRNCTVKRVRATPLNGGTAFVAILVTHDGPRTYPQSVEISSNTVYDFGRTGIVANNAGTTANIHHNVVTGQGPTPVIPQTGIQIGDGATGTMAFNNVSAISYTGTVLSSASLLLQGSGGTCTIHDNTVNSGQVGIYLIQNGFPGGACNAVVYGNTITASTASTGLTEYYGIVTYSTGGALSSAPGAHKRPLPASPYGVPVKLPASEEADLASMTVTLAGNTLVSQTPGTGAGAYLLALDTSPQQLAGDSNSFAGYAVGVVTDKDPGASLHSLWRRNSCTGNGYGMINLTGLLQDARYNWWGDPTGPRDIKTLPGIPNYNNPNATGDPVTAFIEYNPWYTNAARTALSYYPLTVTTTGPGTVTRVPDSTAYLYFTDVVLTAVPAPLHHLAGWSGDTVTTANPLTLRMTGPKSVTATFTINQYPLNLTVVGGGQVTRSPDQASYDAGTVVTLTAAANDGFLFVGWTGDTTTAANPLTLTMNGPRNITATFATEVFPINLTITGSGTVTRVPNLPGYGFGTSVTLTAVPGGSYSFEGWTGDTTTSANPITVTVWGPLDLTATFIGDKYVSVPPESLLLKNPINNRLRRPSRPGYDLFPIWTNFLAEVVTQGGFQPLATESDQMGGMVVGVSYMQGAGTRWRPNRDSARIHGWVRLTKWQFNRHQGAGYDIIQRTLEDRTGMHTGRPRGLDVLTIAVTPPARVLTGEKRILPPKKHNNRLFAEMVALKLSIAASQLGKTPAGFGELVFQQPGHAFHGLMIREIAARTDSLMTYWQGRPYTDYDSMYSAIARINRAFVAPMDTVSWAGPRHLILNGLVRLSSVSFLQGPATPPVMLERTSDDREALDEFDADEGDADPAAPLAVKLRQNYPNPFNPSTMLRFDLRGAAIVSIRVYDILGRPVGTLVDGEELDEGGQEVEFVAEGLSSGTYFYRVEATDIETGQERVVQTGKMLLLK